MKFKSFKEIYLQIMLKNPRNIDVYEKKYDRRFLISHFLSQNISNFILNSNFYPFIFLIMVYISDLYLF
jgi:hypothetical protein